MFLFNVKDHWVNNDGYYVSKWKWEESPSRLKAEIVKGATKRASAFIAVSGGKPEHHNFKLVTDTKAVDFPSVGGHVAPVAVSPTKIVVGEPNSNSSDELLLLLSIDSSARSQVTINRGFTSAEVVREVSAANAAGNELAVIAKFEKDQKLVIKQTGRYTRWEMYTWDGSLKFQKFTNDEEFKYVVQQN